MNGIAREGEPAAPLLEVSDVTVQRGEVTILDSLSVSIPEGRHTAVLGPNGSGKTSLLNVLLRHFYPSVGAAGHQGTVRILGQSVWEVAALRRQMGVVSSAVDAAFSSGRTGRMTGGEAVASGYTATELPEFGVPMTGETVENARRALDRVDAAHLLHRHVATLSTGERRRVLIARALVHRPRILILDEPTTGLDLVARHHFLAMLRRIAQGGEVTLVIVTHHTEEILPEVEHVVLLERGRVAFAGPKEKALTDERLSALYKMPLRLEHREDGTSVAILDPVRD
ncbi:ABC transporter ATP-binding protein [Candidatus Laterigemmans baculatus]|uniref:ABC transporter ATP-binding protein n=1 Tax=Candidatus Laterigemmans baculatus TaxID=2770505 RepID=UPI0013DACF94|nr:ATP-binding cassette domain-containing protein [Candidatus Laterigemmans baculatus]